MIGVITFIIGVYMIIGFLCFEPFLDYIEEGLPPQAQRMTKKRALKVLLMQVFWPVTLLAILAKSLYDCWVNLPAEEVPAKPGKYKVLDYNLPKSRLKQLHDYLSEKLLKEVLKK